MGSGNSLTPNKSQAISYTNEHSGDFVDNNFHNGFAVPK